nr:glycosyltransferase [Paenibacillus chibensis]
MMLGLYALVGKKIMLTVHGDSLASQIDHSRFISRWLLIRSLKSIDYIASVSESTTQKLLDMGLDENKVRTLPAYIRPRVSQKDMVKIPSEVIGFMEDAEIVISANGYVRFYRNEDLYGLDLLIELMKELVCISHHIRLVFAVMGVPEQSILERAYYDQLKDRIKGYGLENHFYFYEVIDAPFYPILMKSHLFVRPTCTDGYGVSIAEALQCSVPSIASDVCERPQGTIEFQSRNSKDLFAKVMHVLNHYEACKRDAGNVRMEDYGPKLIEIYRQITGKEGKNRGAVKWGYGK